VTRDRVANRSEAGASLIMALAMVTLISVALVSTLGFATASLRTVSVIGAQRSNVYAADGAVQTAIQAMRYSATAGTTAVGSACPQVDYPAIGAQPAVAVTCEVVAKRASATMPPYAIWALGSSASENGISMTPTGTVEIAGPIASNSPADGTGGFDSVDVGTLGLSGYSVDAKGSCAGIIIVTAPADKRCNTGVSLTDPGYPSQTLPALTVPNPSPTCAATNAVLQFSPGYYTDSAVLAPTSYTANGKVCTSGYLYFQPGVYYFDFGIDPAFASTVWSVAANQKIVGGEPNAWDPNTADSLPPVPGGGAAAACKTETNGGTAGVQFVFGGASHMNVIASGSTVELCADPTPTGTNQQIAIYGQTSAATPAAAATVTRVPSGSAPTPSSGWTGLSPTNNVLPISPATSTIDTQVASYSIPAGATASMNLTGYAGTSSALPAGAANVSYSLQVAHQETASSNGNISSLKATITPVSGAACTVTATKHATSTVTAPITDSIPLTGTCAAAVASDGFTIDYVAKTTASKTFIENLDGIDVVMTYTPPAARAESGCVLTDITNCSIIKVGTSTAKVYVWGTVYAPLAAITANYVASGAFEFRRGVIARTIVNAGTPPADSTVGFCLGAGSPCVGPARVLRLVATVNGSVRVRALVRYTDAPALGFSAQILSWNVLRG
jgi:hypothetical protein